MKMLGKFIAVMILVSAWASPSSAVDFIKSVQSGVKTVTNTIDSKVIAPTTKIKTELQQVITNFKEKYEAVVNDVVGKLVNKFTGNKEDEKPIASAKEIETESMSLDDVNPEDIANKVTQLFMAYPSHDPAIRDAYKDKTEQFWNDTLVELYVVSRTFDDQIEELQKQIDALSNPDTLTGSDSSAGVTSGENPDDMKILRGSYDAYATFEELVKLAEILTVLRAEYKAARFIRYNVTPAPYVEGKKASSSDYVIKNKYADISSIRKTYNMSFAALGEIIKAKAFNENKIEKKEGETVKFSAVKGEEVKVSPSVKADKLQSVGGNVFENRIGEDLKFNNKISEDLKSSTVKEEVKVAPSVKAEKLQSVGENVFENKIGEDLKSSVVKKSGTELTPVLKTNKLQTVKDNALVRPMNEDTDKRVTSTEKSDKNKVYGGYKFNVKENSNIKYSKAEEPTIKSSFSNAKDDFAALKEMSEAREAMTKAMTVHNIKQSLDSYKDLFETYHDIVERHKQSIENLKQSDNCTVNFLSNYYKNPELVWYGSSKPSDPTEYESRKGISGWIYKTYQTAKAELSDGEFSADSLGTVDFDREDDDGSDVGSTVDRARTIVENKYNNDNEEDDEDEGEEDTGDTSNEEEKDNDTGMIPGTVGTSDQAGMKQSARFREKFNFLIGANIARSLANDQVGGQRWGKPYRTFPLWNDQKNFYDKYLEKKYTNMINYVKATSFLEQMIDVVYDLRKMVKEDPDDKDKASIVKGQLKQIYDAYYNNKNEINQIVNSRNPLYGASKQYKDGLRKLEQNQAKLNESIKQKIAEYNEKLDEINTEIESVQANIDQLEDTISNAKSQEKQSDSDIENEDRKMKDFKNKTSGLKIFAMFTKQEKKSEREIAEASLKQQKEALKKLNKNRASIEEKLVEAKQQIIKNNDAYEEIYVNYLEQSQNNIQEVTDNIPLTYYNTEDVYETFIQKPQYKSVVKNYLMQADAGLSPLPNCFKSYAVSRITQTLNQINNLNDFKYTEAGAKQIQALHAKLIHDLKNISAAELLEKEGSVCGGVTGSAIPTKYLEYAKAAYEKAIISKVCSEDSCLEQDTDYFVGIVPTERDFRAPHAMENNVLPPMREIVYFDNEDYTSVPKRRHWVGFRRYMKTTRKGIIEKLPDLPDIWLKIINPQSYVEAGYDMKNIKMTDAGANTYMRGGIYPCKLGDYYIDVISQTRGKRLVYNIMNKRPKDEFAKVAIPECQEIYVDDTGTNMVFGMTNLGEKDRILTKMSGITDKVYNTSGSKQWIKTGREYNKSSSFDPSVARVSELSTLFAYLAPQTSSTLVGVDNAVGRIVISETPMNVYRAMKGSNETDAEAKVPLYIANAYHTQMNRNQFGDFLTMVETEQGLSQAESQLKQEVVSLSDRLIASLKEAGIEIKTAFIDLADPAQYLDVSQKLEKSKNNSMKNFYNKLGAKTPQIQENETLNEEYDLLRKVYMALWKDSDELIVIDKRTDGTSSEFEKDIKSEKVNRATMEKYKKEANENKQVLQPPYCAVYPIYEGLDGNE